MCTGLPGGTDLRLSEKLALGERNRMKWGRVRDTENVPLAERPGGIDTGTRTGRGKTRCLFIWTELHRTRELTTP